MLQKRDNGIILKTPAEIEAMRIAGQMAGFGKQGPGGGAIGMRLDHCRQLSCGAFRLLEPEVNVTQPLAGFYEVGVDLERAPQGAGCEDQVLPVLGLPFRFRFLAGFFGSGRGIFPAYGPRVVDQSQDVMTCRIGRIFPQQLAQQG